LSPLCTYKQAARHASRPRRRSKRPSKQPTLKQGSKRGTIDPSVVVRRSRFETTALEMPAEFGLLTIAPTLHALGGRARTYGQAM
jgi:hypothetical protein